MAELSRPASETLECVRFAGFTLDVAGRVLADPDGREVPLRRSEFCLLQAFLRAPGRVLSRDHLLDAVAGRLSAPYDRSVDVLVSRLRHKIEANPKSPSLILTVAGAGYKFTEKPKSVEAAPEPANERAEAPPRPRSAERRQLTIMRCGLAGSAGLSARLDPEDFGSLIATYQACCTRVIAGLGGAVAKVLGGDVLAYFGYPKADEHDAERAIRAGLAVTREVVTLDNHLHARVGIATGLVVVGELPDDQGGLPAALGEAPELAAELLAVAKPDTVVISAGCERLPRGLFEYEPLKSPDGSLARAARAFRVIGERPAESRFAALHQARLIPLVGRTEELAVLVRRWEQARAGNGRVVLIAGEAGMGKSRLVSELRTRLAEDAHAALVCSCAPHRQDSPYHPFTDCLERTAGFARRDDDARRFQKLEALLRRSKAGAEAVTLIADLLSVKIPGRGLDLTPHQRRERTAKALVDQVVEVAARVPVLLIFEDVHWIDPTSREVLDTLVDRVAGLPVLLLVTFRPEFVPPWTSRAHATTIVLNGLDRCEAGKMIGRVTGEDVPEALSCQIIDHADGVPLFVEELARAVMQSASLREAASNAAVTVPRTLQSSLIARLDRMPDARTVAQIGAAIGREFPHHLLAAVADIPETDLQRGLGELMGSTLVYRRGEPPDALYTFKHALVRDAAYETMLRARRQALHAAIAKELTARRDAGEDLGPELLGHHCEQAGMIADAVGHYLRAGERAAARSALVEARAHLTRGLALAMEMPVEAERRLRQAELMLALGNVQFALQGVGSPEQGAGSAELGRLCRDLDPQHGDASRLHGRALYGEWLHGLLAGQILASHASATELLALGRMHRDLEIRVMSAACHGTSCFFLGRLDAAAETFAGAMAEQGAGVEAVPMMDFGVDARTALQRARSRLLACQGFPDQAREQARASLEKARQLRHLPTIAMALAVSCDTAWILRDWHSLEIASSRLVELASEHGFRFWLARGKGYQGSAAAAAGRGEEGRALLAGAMAELASIGISLFGPHMRAMLAEAHVGMGQPDLALGLLEEALGVSSRTGEAWMEAELHRRRGELLRDAAGAECCFRRAIGIAQRQSARLFELRAAVSLARFLREAGRCGEARGILEPICRWFTEGFGIPDLMEAKALLDQLRPARAESHRARS